MIRIAAVLAATLGFAAGAWCVPSAIIATAAATM